MHGRDRELRLLTDLLRLAEAGRGGMLLVEGEPGVGKTSLLIRASAAAAERGFSVAWGNPAESTQAPSAGPQVSTLKRRPPMVAVESGPRQAGALRRAGCPQEPQLSVPGQRVAHSQLLIMVDDLQWADTATLGRLRCLPARPTAGAPFWILARSTMGTDNEVERLFAYLERAGSVRMRLAPLDDETWAGAVACTLGAVPGHNVLALAADAGGNPFLLTELLGGLQDEGGILVEAGRARLVSDQLPKRLREAVRRWMSDLRPRARHPLEVGAVLGRSFAVDTLAALLGDTPAELLPDIEAALAAGILMATKDSLAFRTDSSGKRSPPTSLRRRARHCTCRLANCCWTGAAHRLRRQCI
ncbi:MAG TPA: AAA family ATPase [Streptosporangiaceae bacterium]|nr:AAA family ATPase [Streptosporangiaceae bacterium]